MNLDKLRNLTRQSERYPKARVNKTSLEELSYHLLPIAEALEREMISRPHEDVVPCGLASCDACKALKALQEALDG